MIIVLFISFINFSSLAETQNSKNMNDNQKNLPSWLVKGDSGRLRAVKIFNYYNNNENPFDKNLQKKFKQSMKQCYLRTKKWFKKLQALYQIKIKYDDPKKYNIIAEAVISAGSRGINYDFVCSIQYDSSTIDAGLVVFNWRLNYNNPNGFTGTRMFEADFPGNQNRAWMVIRPFIEESFITWEHAMEGY